MKRWIPTATVLSIVLIAATALTWSHDRAVRSADAIMKPTFADGWCRWHTKLRPYQDKAGFHVVWQVRYDKTNSAAIIDFGPEVWTSLSGNVIHLNPTNLVEKIERHTRESNKPSEAIQ